MNQSALSVADLSHSFGRSVALRDINLTIRSGEVLGILGENGAGKSTLLNVLSGTLRPHQGVVAINGAPLALRTYHDANLTGIWRIFQDPALIGGMPVYESFFLGHEAHFVKAGLLRKAEMARLTRDVVRSMGVEVDVKSLMLNYDFATRQALEVCRAIALPKILGLPAGFVLFDEPTTGLSRAEVVRLLANMDRLRREGVGVAFVSHRLHEIFDVCDRLTVLKDGAIVGGGPVADFNETRLHQLMVGRSLDAPMRRRSAATALSSPPLLMVDGLSQRNPFGAVGGRRRAELHEISLEIRPGEIVGIGGLLGSGKGQLLRILAGDLPMRDGVVRLAGKPLKGSIAQRKRDGVAFVPGDRVHEAVIRTADVKSNISLPSGEAGKIGFSNHLGFWRSARERSVAKQMIASLRIKANPGQPVQALSGGNQQKVALARWIHREPRLLLIENPTAGVDVGAKREIYALLTDLAARGTAILYVTDDLPELITLSDRILVMRDGRIVRDIDNREETAKEDSLVAAMIGSGAETGPALHAEVG